jgi:putative copper export protein
MPKMFVFGVVRSLHGVFTALWIGGLLTTAFTFMPVFKEAKEKIKGLGTLLVAYQKRLGTVALVSIIGLWITGLLLGKQSQAYSGFMSFANTYNALLSVKHLLIFVMIFVAFYRRFVLGKKIMSFDTRQQKLYGMLLMLNTVLGVVVLFLSGISSAMG